MTLTPQDGTGALGVPVARDDQADPLGRLLQDLDQLVDVTGGSAMSSSARLHSVAVAVAQYRNAAQHIVYRPQAEVTAAARRGATAMLDLIAARVGGADAIDQLMAEALQQIQIVEDRRTRPAWNDVVASMTSLVASALGESLTNIDPATQPAWNGREACAMQAARLSLQDAGQALRRAVAP